MCEGEVAVVRVRDVGVHRTVLQLGIGSEAEKFGSCRFLSHGIVLAITMVASGEGRRGVKTAKKPVKYSGLMMHWSAGGETLENVCAVAYIVIAAVCVHCEWWICFMADNGTSGARVGGDGSGRGRRPRRVERRGWKLWPEPLSAPAEHMRVANKLEAWCQDRGLCERRIQIARVCLVVIILSHCHCLKVHQGLRI